MLLLAYFRCQIVLYPSLLLPFPSDTNVSRVAPKLQVTFGELKCAWLKCTNRGIKGVTLETRQKTTTNGVALRREKCFLLWSSDPMLHGCQFGVAQLVGVRQSIIFPPYPLVANPQVIGLFFFLFFFKFRNEPPGLCELVRNDFRMVTFFVLLTLSAKPEGCAFFLSVVGKRSARLWLCGH